jgi:hypothetical protein
MSRSERTTTCRRTFSQRTEQQADRRPHDELRAKRRDPELP